MRIAVAQAPGVSLTQWQPTLVLVDDLIGRAADPGADVVVLPECVWPAYCLGRRPDYDGARAAGLPGPDFFVQHLQQIARRRRIAVCAGYVDEVGDRLLNAACLIAGDGRLLGVRHKCFLWAFDRDVFTAGERIEPIDTPFGRVGLLICADARLPEISATLAARGAGLLLQPTAWVNAGTPDSPWNPQPDFLISARAAEFGIPIASASKWGRELDTDFVGSSLICDCEGRVLARCGGGETAVVVADVTVRPPRRPNLTPDERRVLLSPEIPTVPRSDVRDLTVVVLRPGEDAEAVAVRHKSSPVLMLQHDTTGSGPPRSPTRWGAQSLLLRGPARPVEIAGIRVAAVAVTDLLRFAAVRVLALQGVHVVVAFGGDVEDGLVKARACENRIFAVQVETAQWRVIDPRGIVVSEGKGPGGPAEDSAVCLPVRLAANKEVAPGTDVVAGRRPAQYAF